MKSVRAHPHEKPHHPHRPLAVLLFAFVLLLGLFSVHESSTWLHIQTGVRILAERAVPAADGFSYTFSGRPWTTDSWLADVLFQRLHGSAGPWGLIVLKAVTCAAAFTLLLPVSASSPLLAASVLALGAVAAWPGLTETPFFFDALLLALLLRALRPRSRFHWAMVAQVGLIELLWSNLHGSTAVLGLWVTGLKAFKAGLREEHPGDSLRQGALVAAAAAGFILNPLGFGAMTHMFGQAGSALAGWQSVSSAVGLYALFVLLGVWACWITLQQEFFMTVTAATLLLLSFLVPVLRPLYILAVCPVITLALGHFIHPLRDTHSRLARLVAVMAGVFALHYYWIYVPFSGLRGYGSESMAGVLHFLDSNGVRGRMFNEPESGEALLAGGRPVFVDARVGLYGRLFLKDAAHWSLQWRQLREVYGFDYAVILNRRAGSPARVLDEDPEWRLAYADDTALLYVRKTGGSGWLVSSTPRRLAAPNRLWPDGIDAALAEPRTRARVLDELDRWIVQSPDSAQALLWKAYALDALKLPQKAERLISVAGGRPRAAWDPELLACLGFIQERRGRGAEARRAYERAALLARRAGNRAVEAEVLPRLAVLLEAGSQSGRGQRLRERAEGLSARLISAD
jgi:hypothetical protein